MKAPIQQLSAACAAAVVASGMAAPAASEPPDLRRSLAADRFLLYDVYEDPNDSETVPEIEAANIGLLASDPGELQFLLQADAQPPAEMTVNGFAAIVFDTDLDGTPDHGTLTPDVAMEQETLYSTPLYEVNGDTATPTAQSTLWVWEGTDYYVRIPWRDAGWSTVAWQARMTDGNGVVDFAPEALSDPVDLLGALKPGRVTKVKVKRTKKAAKVRWKAQPAADTYIVKVGVNGKKPKAFKKTKKTSVRIKTTRGSRYRVQIRARGVGGLGPWKTVKFRGR